MPGCCQSRAGLRARQQFAAPLEMCAGELGGIVPGGMPLEDMGDVVGIQDTRVVEECVQGTLQIQGSSGIPLQPPPPGVRASSGCLATPKVSLKLPPSLGFQPTVSGERLSPDPPSPARPSLEVQLIAPCERSLDPPKLPKSSLGHQSIRLCAYVEPRQSRTAVPHRVRMSAQ